MTEETSTKTGEVSPTASREEFTKTSHRENWLSNLGFTFTVEYHYHKGGKNFLVEE